MAITANDRKSFFMTVLFWLIKRISIQIYLFLRHRLVFPCGCRWFLWHQQRRGNPKLRTAVGRTWTTGVKVVLHSYDMPVTCETGELLTLSKFKKWTKAAQLSLSKTTSTTRRF
jgi:hypothetical protein